MSSLLKPNSRTWTLFWHTAKVHRMLTPDMIISRLLNEREKCRAAFHSLNEKGFLASPKPQRAIIAKRAFVKSRMETAYLWRQTQALNFSTESGGRVYWKHALLENRLKGTISDCWGNRFRHTTLSLPSFEFLFFSPSSHNRSRFDRATQLLSQSLPSISMVKFCTVEISWRSA